MLNIQVQITGDKATVAKLKKLGKNFNDWTPELKQVGEYLQKFYSTAVFETEGGILGMRWPALSPAYEFWKRQKWPGRGILVRTGKLKESFKYEVGPTYVEVMNPVDYAVYHQQGRGVPKRMLIFFEDRQKNAIIDIFKTGIARKIEAAIKA